MLSCKGKFLSLPLLSHFLDPSGLLGVLSLPHVPPHPHKVAIVTLSETQCEKKSQCLHCHTYIPEHWQCQVNNESLSILCGWFSLTNLELESALLKEKGESNKMYPPQDDCQELNSVHNFLAANLLPDAGCVS